MRANLLEHSNQRVDSETHAGPNDNAEQDAAEPSPARETASCRVDGLRLIIGPL